MLSERMIGEMIVQAQQRIPLSEPGSFNCGSTDIDVVSACHLDFVAFDSHVLKPLGDCNSVSWRANVPSAAACRTWSRWAVVMLGEADIIVPV